MNEAMELYGRLSPWKPLQLAGFRVNDLVDVQGLGRCRIVALIPPSLVELQTEQGGRCKCGWRAIKKVSASTPTGERENKAPNRHETGQETNRNG